METGGLFGISVTRFGEDTAIGNILELEYDEHIEAWMPTAIEHAREVASNLSSDAIIGLRSIGIEDFYAWVLHRNAADRLLAADEYTASAYAHLIMMHHRTKYGVLLWDNGLFPSFQKLEASDSAVALDIMTRMLPRLTAALGRC